MHRHTTEKLPVSNALAARIAALSEEFLDATPDRRNAIGEEIAGLISGRIAPFPAQS